MLNKLLLSALIVLLAFVFGGFLLPKDYHIERSILINQPPSVVFTLLNSYKSFNQWSPWAARDPDAQFSFSGPESGVGSKMSWSGDPRLSGEGWQQITTSSPYSRIEVHLDFGEQGVADSFFMITEDGAGSMVTWGFDTDVTSGKGMLGQLMGKYFGLMLDRWVGADYEQGLASFKAWAESLPSSDFSQATIEIVEAEAVEILYVSGKSSQEASDVAQALATAYEEITLFMASRQIELSGQPIAITRGWDEDGYQFDAALPVNRLPESTIGNVKSGFSPSGRAVRYSHQGPYEEMLQAYEQLASFMAANSLPEGPLSWEHYISDPANTPTEEIITHIYILVGD